MSSPNIKTSLVAFVSLIACVEAAGEGPRDTKPKEPIAAHSVASTKNGSDVLRPEFDALDRDGDGFLSKAEIQAYPRATAGEFEKADKNHDGKLDLEEFKILHANTSTDRRLGSQ